MSRPETETRSPPARPPDAELDVEQEFDVDVGRYFASLVSHWYIPLVGLAAGVVIGLLATVGGGRSYRAQTVVYLGQPLFPGTTTPTFATSTSFRFVDQLVHSDRVLRQASERVGVSSARLDRNVSLGAFSAEGPVKEGTVGRLVTLTVTGLPAAKAKLAADTLGSSLIQGVSAFTNQKLATYQARTTRAQRELAFVRARIASATAEQTRVLANTSVPSTEKLLVLANLNNVITFNEQRRANLEQSLIGLRDQIATTRQVEEARILEPADVSRAPGASRRAAAFYGGLAGLVIGGVLALFWDRLAAGVKSRRRV